MEKTKFYTLTVFINIFVVILLGLISGYIVDAYGFENVREKLEKNYIYLTGHNGGVFRINEGHSPEEINSELADIVGYNGLYPANAFVDGLVKVNERDFVTKIFFESIWQSSIEKNYIVTEGRALNDSDSGKVIGILVGGYAFDNVKIGEPITVTNGNKDYECIVQGKIKTPFDTYGIDLTLEGMKTNKAVIIMPGEFIFDFSTDAYKEIRLLTNSIEAANKIDELKKINMLSIGDSNKLIDNYEFVSRGNNPKRDIYRCIICGIVATVITIAINAKHKEKGYLCAFISMTVYVLGLVIGRFVFVDKVQFAAYCEPEINKLLFILIAVFGIVSIVFMAAWLLLYKQKKLQIPAENCIDLTKLN